MGEMDLFMRHLIKGKYLAFLLCVCGGKKTARNIEKINCWHEIIILFRKILQRKLYTSTWNEKCLFLNWSALSIRQCCICLGTTRHPTNESGWFGRIERRSLVEKNKTCYNLKYFDLVRLPLHSRLSIRKLSFSLDHLHTDTHHSCVRDLCTSWWSPSSRMIKITIIIERRRE